MTRQVAIGGSGLFALVDEADYPLVSAKSWHLRRRPRSSPVAQCRTSVGGVTSTTTMHRVIMAAQPGQLVDHANGDGLDNRRGNLRFCSKTENNRNKAYYGTSGYKGVFHRPRKAIWFAQICVDHKRIYLGMSKDKLKVAALYDCAARAFHGDFARLNHPDQPAPDWAVERVAAVASRHGMSFAPKRGGER